MITLKNISLSFLNQQLFNNLSETFSLDDRVGLVGANGAGKSTLLKIIAGLQKPDNGNVLLGQSKIAYLPQEIVLTSNRTVLDEAFCTFDSGKLLEKQQELEKKLKENPDDQKLANELIQIANDLTEHNPTKDLLKVKEVLDGLGFAKERLEQNVNQLSVGWQMRLVLAKLLLQEADFYLFDEPTNHLDITTKEWFLSFLQNSNTGFLLISHERYFLNKLCTKTLALEHGNGKMYNGNYSFYEKERELELQRLKSAYLTQQKEIEKKQDTINKFRATATKAKMVQSMIKELDRVELIELPPEIKKIKLPFGEIKKSNRHVMSVKNLSFGYEKDFPLFKNVNFEIERNQKVAIVAPNGKGKTTLFKLLVNKLKPSTGTIAYDEKSEFAIFEQDEYSSLELNKSVFENVSNAVNATYEKVRSFLGAFLFDSESIEKKVKVLSGGEKNRVKLVKALLKNANLLLLDEPTNHLDIPSKDILVEALNDFPGTILFVSHDRDFINKVATHVIDLQENNTHMYTGNYDEYLDQVNNIMESGNKLNSSINKTSNKSESKNNKKELHEIEKNISKLEEKIKKHNQKFLTLEYGNPEFDKALKQLQEYEKELETLVKEWEEII